MKYLKDRFCLECGHMLIEHNISKTSNLWAKVITCCDCHLIHDLIPKEQQLKVKEDEEITI